MGEGMMGGGFSASPRDLGDRVRRVSSKRRRGARGDHCAAARSADSLTPTLAIPMIARMSGKPALSIAAVLSFSLATALASPREVFDAILAAYGSHSFRLTTDLRIPESGGQPAPSLDLKGWRHNDPNQPVLLQAGEEADVTGGFNYGDKGVFLEISGKDPGKGGAERPHLRVRFNAEAPPEKPDVQITELTALIAKVLKPLAP